MNDGYRCPGDALFGEVATDEVVYLSQRFRGEHMGSLARVARIREGHREMQVAYGELIRVKAFNLALIRSFFSLGLGRPNQCHST